MNSDIETYQKILDNLKLSHPVAPEEQENAIKSGEKNLRIILKKAGYYSAFFGFMLTIYYLLRNFGIKATVFKSKALITIVAANAATGGAITGHYVVTEYILPPPEVIEEKVEETVFKEPIIEKIKDDQKDKLKIIESDIGVQAFSGSVGPS